MGYSGGHRVVPLREPGAGTELKTVQLPPMNPPWNSHRSHSFFSQYTLGPWLSTGKGSKSAAAWRKIPAKSYLFWGLPINLAKAFSGLSWGLRLPIQYVLPFISTALDLHCDLKFLPNHSYSVPFYRSQTFLRVSVLDVWFYLYVCFSDFKQKTVKKKKRQKRYNNKRVNSAKGYNKSKYICTQYQATQIYKSNIVRSKWKR